MLDPGKLLREICYCEHKAPEDCRGLFDLLPLHPVSGPQGWSGYQSVGIQLP